MNLVLRIFQAMQPAVKTMMHGLGPARLIQKRPITAITFAEALKLVATWVALLRVDIRAHIRADFMTTTR